MRYDFEVKEVDKQTALDMVQKYHYSNTLPKLNKVYLGFYTDWGGKEKRLVGLITLGWGTRPLHTIAKLFPTLTTNDYYEIGRMCMTEDMPRNSESQMISACVKWLKANHPEKKILFTWADGMMGKPGYVYQACSFIYAGSVEGEMYIQHDAVKIHTRKMKALFASPEDKRITVRPTLEQMKEYDIKHYRGKQYRYFKFLCGKQEKRHLLKECQVDLTQPLPKYEDLKWRVKDIDTGKWMDCGKPPYVTDFWKGDDDD